MTELRVRHQVGPSPFHKCSKSAMLQPVCTFFPAHKDTRSPHSSHSYLSYLQGSNLVAEPDATAC